MNAPSLLESKMTTPIVQQRSWSFVAAGLLALIYLVTSILIARHRLFWYDEILTITFSRLSDLSSIWKALTHGGDGMPPTYYAVVRMFERLPIPLEISARLPSALAMVIGMLITFDCARRLTDGFHGLIAFAVLSCSILPYYSYEARPYALYFMFASTALWLWLGARDKSKLSALLFGFVIFLAVAVHYYAVLCLVPYAAWEAWNWRGRHAPSSRLIAGFVAVLFAGALFSSQILSMHRILSPASWSPATMASLAAIYDDFFPYALFPLIGIMILVALAGPGKRVGRPSGCSHPSNFAGFLPLYHWPVIYWQRSVLMPSTIATLLACCPGSRSRFLVYCGGSLRVHDGYPSQRFCSLLLLASADNWIWYGIRPTFALSLENRSRSG